MADRALSGPPGAGGRNHGRGSARRQRQGIGAGIPRRRSAGNPPPRPRVQHHVGRSAPQGGRNVASAATSRTIERRQDAVPGQYEPRNPHPAERRGRHDRTDEPDRPHPGAAGLCRAGDPIQPGAAAVDRRHPRPVAHRSWPLGVGGSAVPPTHARAGPAGAVRRSGTRQGADAERVGARRLERRADRRQAQVVAGAGQSDRKRAEVHATWLDRDHRRRHCAERFGHASAVRGRRYRHRHPSRTARSDFRGVLPGGCIHDPPLRRHRPRPVDRPPAMPHDGRRDRREQRSRSRLDVLVYRRDGSRAAHRTPRRSACSATASISGRSARARIARCGARDGPRISDVRRRGGISGGAESRRTRSSALTAGRRQRRQYARHPSTAGDFGLRRDARDEWHGSS